MSLIKLGCGAAIALAYATAARAGSEAEAPEFFAPPSVISAEKWPRKVLPTRTFAVTADQMPLAGAGTIEFPVQFAGLPLAQVDWPKPLTLEAELWFDQQGKPGLCHLLAMGDMSAPKQPSFTFEQVEASLCAQFARSARFQRSAWHTVPFKRGFVTVKITVTRKLTPQLPVQLTTSTQGAGVPVTLTLRGEKLYCEASLRRVDRSGAQAICAAVIQTDYAGRTAAWLSKQADNNSTSFLAHVRPQLLPAAGEVTVEIAPGPLDLMPDYAEPEPLPMLAESAGTLGAEVRDDDNPFAGQSYYVEGRTKALLGVDAMGRVKTCRPLISAGVALLDNRACALLAERGQFSFSNPKDQRFAGLRYWMQGVRWAAPE